MLNLYWIEFPDPENSYLPMGVRLGIGVTAGGEREAKDLVASVFFKDEQMPEPIATRQIRDISELDQNHVIPNMGNHLRRGVWFPRLS